MAFDIRFQDYTFKHSVASKPDPSAERYREHFHITYEFLYFVEGNADFMLQHNRYSIRPGSLLIAKPGEYHNIIFKTTDPYKRYVIRFNPHTVYPYVRRQLEKAESVYYIEGSPIVEEFHRMDEYVMLILWKSDGELA